VPARARLYGRISLVAGVCVLSGNCLARPLRHCCLVCLASRQARSGSGGPRSEVRERGTRERERGAEREVPRERCERCEVILSKIIASSQFSLATRLSLVKGERKVRSVVNETYDVAATPCSHDQHPRLAKPTCGHTSSPHASMSTTGACRGRRIWHGSVVGYHGSVAHVAHPL